MKRKKGDFSMQKSISLPVLFCLLFVIIISIILIGTVSVAAAEKAEINGSFEKGDKVFTDPAEEVEEEFVDFFNYDRLWLRYKKTFANNDYFWLKGTYYNRVYDVREIYDSLALSLDGNYTFNSSERWRNRVKFHLKDKDYAISPQKSYHVYRIAYQLDFARDDLNDYTFYLQRQWNNYQNSPDKDYYANRISLNWSRDLTEKLSIEAKIQYDEQIHTLNSASTDKFGKKFAINFKYRL